MNNENIEIKQEIESSGNELVVADDEINDPLDLPAELDLAKQHGNAQLLYKIIDEDKLDSKNMIDLIYIIRS